MQDYQFTIDDTSPLIAYTPPTLGPNVIPGVPPNLDDGWHPQFDNSFLFFSGAPGLGNRTSTHITNREGATIAFNFTGTSITLLGFANQANYDIILDGETRPGLTPTSTPGDNQPSTEALFFARDLSNGAHSIQLVVHARATPGSFVIFDKAIVQASIQSSSAVNVRTVPSTSLNLIGTWSFEQIDPNTPFFQDASLLQFHESSTAGDTAVFSFPRSANLITSMTVLGLTDPSAGLYSVSLALDNGFVSTQRFNGSFGWQAGTELFVASGLPTDQGDLSLTITNLDSGRPLRISALNISSVSRLDSGATTTSSTSPSLSPTDMPFRESPGQLPAGTIAALVMGTIACVFVFILILFLFLLRRRQKQRRQMEMIQAPQPRRNLGGSKTRESGESIIEIGRAAPTAAAAGGVASYSVVDRFAPPYNPLTRQQSLPRTVTTGGGNAGNSGRGFGGGGGGPGFSEPYSNWDYSGPPLRPVDQAPIVFSFDSRPASRRGSRSSKNSGAGPSGSIGSTKGSAIGHAATSKATKERTGALAALTGAAPGDRATFLDLETPRGDRADSGSSGGTKPVPVDVPVAAANLSGDEDQGSSSRPQGASQPAVGDDKMFVPTQISPSSQDDRNRSLGRSQSRETLAITASDFGSTGSNGRNGGTNPSGNGGGAVGVHPYSYGTGYRPTTTSTTGTGAQLIQAYGDGEGDMARRERPLDRHPYALAMAMGGGHSGSQAEESPDATRHSPQSLLIPTSTGHQTQLTPMSPQSNETEMVFSRPDTTDLDEQQQRRLPPGIGGATSTR